MKTTIKDIAKILNISHTTVSRALGDSPLIKDETKRKIQKIARELNYSPNIAARGLALNRSYNIGLFTSKQIENMHTSFLYEVMDGINSAIGDIYNIVFRKLMLNEDLASSIGEKKYDGLLFLSIDISDTKLIHKLMSLPLPVVILNRDINKTDCYYIYADEYRGAVKAVEYLIKLQHKHIAIITGPDIFITSGKRYSGYEDTLKKYDLPVKNEYIIKGKFTPESGFCAMEKLLKQKKVPSAVFASNDLMAAGAIKACNKLGYKVPDDFSIIGFDNMDFSKFLIPSLSTIGKSRRDMGREGAAMLLDLISGKKIDKKNKKVKTELIIRESCAEIKRVL